MFNFNRKKFLTLGAAALVIIVLQVLLYTWHQQQKTSLDNYDMEELPSDTTSEPTNETTENKSSTPPKEPAEMAEIPKYIHRTYKTANVNELPGSWPSYLETWKSLNPDYNHTIFDDQAAEDYVRETFPEYFEAYNSFPVPILKADFFRYLILLGTGGVYSDMDTSCLKPIDQWAANHPEAKFIVGIEADVCDTGTCRPDWHDWYPRKLQLVQWTIVSTPNHPILRKLADTIVKHTPKYMKEGQEDSNKWNIMEWTGPGVFTDTVLSYLKEKHGIEDSDLSGTKESLLFGDILVLPITGFSPGVGHMGSLSPSDPHAFVEHHFAGQWKVNGL